MKLADPEGVDPEEMLAMSDSGRGSRKPSLYQQQDAFDAMATSQIPFKVGRKRQLA